MNYSRLAAHFHLSPETAQAITPQMIGDYLVCLLLIARTGGPTTEEEIFIENLAESLEIDPLILQDAVEQALQKGSNIGDCVARLKNTQLRDNAYLDACRVTRLDRTTSPEEQYALLEVERGLGISKATADRARQLAKSEDNLLHTFCLIVDQPDPANLWAIYMSIGLRQSDHQRRIIAPAPHETPLEERIHTLALILKLAGVGWRRSAKESVVFSLRRFLQLSEEDAATAMNLAWQLNTSLKSLASEIRTRPLQLLVLSDAYLICLSDALICPFEKSILDALVEEFELQRELAEKLIQVTHDEVAFVAAVDQLNPNSSATQV